MDDARLQQYYQHLAAERLRADEAERRLAAKTKECNELREQIAARFVAPGNAISANGTTYHNIEEVYHQMEEAQALHSWLDSIKVPRKDSKGQQYSLVGRVKILEGAYNVG